jgi:hypothetical protein
MRKNNDVLGHHGPLFWNCTTDDAMAASERVGNGKTDLTW